MRPWPSSGLRGDHATPPGLAFEYRRRFIDAGPWFDRTLYDYFMEGTVHIFLTHLSLHQNLRRSAAESQGKQILGSAA